MSLSGPKPPFDGIAIRCTAADLFKYRGRYVTLIIKIENFDDANSQVAGSCPISNANCDIVGFTSRENITPILEVVCYVDNVNGSLHYQHHAALDDDFDIKGFAQLLPHMQKHSAIFGF